MIIFYFNSLNYHRLTFFRIELLLSDKIHITVFVSCLYIIDMHYIILEWNPSCVLLLSGEHLMSLWKQTVDWLKCIFALHLKYFERVLCACVFWARLLCGPLSFILFFERSPTSPQICYVPTRCLGGRGSNTVKLRELSKKRKRQTKQIASLKEVYLKRKRDKGPPTKN